MPEPATAPVVVRSAERGYPAARRDGALGGWLRRLVALTAVGPRDELDRAMARLYHSFVAAVIVESLAVAIWLFLFWRRQPRLG